MIIILSPAKSLDYSSNFNVDFKTTAKFIDSAELLAKNLKKFEAKTLENLMDISPNLAQLNYERWQNFEKNPTRQALLAYDGDVYEGIEKAKYRQKEFEFAQKHLFIISGLYGILRPMDAIKPYRLEMATDFKNQHFICQNLYQFWQEKINNFINDLEDKVIVNLASQEYFSVISPKKISKKIINIIFKENKGGVLKIVAINAKKARGLMANFAIINKIEDCEKLKDFKEQNYQFSSKLSDKENWVFVR